MTITTTDTTPITAFVWLMTAPEKRHEYMLIGWFLFIVSWNGQQRTLSAWQLATPADAREAAILRTEIDERDGLKLAEMISHKLALRWEDLVPIRKSHDMDAVRQIMSDVIRQGRVLR